VAGCDGNAEQVLQEAGSGAWGRMNGNIADRIWNSYILYICIRIRYYMIYMYIHILHYITYGIALHCITLHYITLLYITLHCIALRYIYIYISLVPHKAVAEVSKVGLYRRGELL
jgi:hypothetical protein